MDRFQELLQRYIANTASTEEEREFLALVKSGKYNHLLDPEILDELRPTQKDLSDADQVSMERVYRKITAMPRRQTSRIVEFRRPRVWLAAAAVIVFAMLVSVWSVNNDQAVSENVIAARKPVTEMTLDKQEVTLPDGTKVILNGRSELRISDTFEKSTREVWLTGEALFDVTHDPSRPFIVNTGDVATRVLGTAFNVNAYSPRRIVVTVLRGLVQVGDDKNVYGKIRPDEQIVVDAISHVFATTQVNAQQVAAWKEKDFVVEDVTFEQAARLIEKQFNVKVVIRNDSLKNCIVTAWFLNNENLHEIVEGLSIVGHATATIKGDSVIINGGKGCQ